MELNNPLFKLVFTCPHMAIKTMRRYSECAKKPCCVDYTVYGSLRNKYEFRISPISNNTNVIATCKRSKIGWRSVVCDFDFLEDWDNKVYDFHFSEDLVSMPKLNISVNYERKNCPNSL